MDPIILDGAIITFEEPVQYKHGGAFIFKFDKEEAKGTVKLVINSFGIDIYHLETSDQPLALMDLFYGAYPADDRPLFQLVIDSPWQTSDNMAFVKFWPEVGTRIQFEFDVLSMPIYPESKWRGYEFGIDDTSWPVDEKESES